MSDASSDVKSMKTVGGTVTPLIDYYGRSRAPNPWPVPMITKQAGGAFGNSGGTGEQPKKYGGGFGSSTYDGFGSVGRSGASGTEDDSKSFVFRKETAGFHSARGGFVEGYGCAMSSSSRLITSDSLNIIKDQCVTPPPTENVLGANSLRRGGFSPRISEAMSPSKRSRTGRRSGRRGRGGPGHCFHCQEHGHISRLCPKKAADTENFEGNETEGKRFVEEEIVSGQPRTVPLMEIGRSSMMSTTQTEDLSKTTTPLPPKLFQSGSLSYQDAKLENQKARESYYGGYSYGSNFSNTVVKSRTGIESQLSCCGEGGRISSSGVDKFSEQLDNALKLHVSESSVSSPRGLTQQGKTGAVSRISPIQKRK
uniref:CCHC-type domain-containing protein n=1 Tax=Caenorhabditis tropicalis TaxID=1561998 RepID=A0A1I7U620_9PELO